MHFTRFSCTSTYQSAYASAVTTSYVCGQSPRTRTRRDDDIYAKTQSWIRKLKAFGHYLCAMLCSSAMVPNLSAMLPKTIWGVCLAHVLVPATLASLAHTEIIM